MQRDEKNERISGCCSHAVSAILPLKTILLILEMKNLILHQVILLFLFPLQTKMSLKAATTWRDLCRITAEESPLRSSSTRGCVHRRDQVSGDE